MCAVTFASNRPACTYVAVVSSKQRFRVSPVTPSIVSDTSVTAGRFASLIEAVSSTVPRDGTPPLPIVTLETARKLCADRSYPPGRGCLLLATSGPDGRIRPRPVPPLRALHRSTASPHKRPVGSAPFNRRPAWTHIH